MGAYTNYFDFNIRKFNRNDFIVLMKPEQIQRDAKNRIFREMIQGYVDYEKYGSYYLDSKFLENIIISAENELMNSNIIANALKLYDISNPGNSLVIMNKNKYEQLSYVYNVLYAKLSMVKSNQDISFLIDIQYILRDYRYLL